MQIRPHSRVKGYAAVLVLACLGLGACNDDDVGVRCEGAPASGSSQTGFAIIQSLDCESRLCIQSRDVAAPIPRCTKFCGGNGDCPGPGPNCSEGYLCRVGAVVALAGADCCKLCICKNDLSLEQRERDLNEEVCKAQGIVPKCQSL